MENQNTENNGALGGENVNPSTGTTPEAPGEAKKHGPWENPLEKESVERIQQWLKISFIINEKAMEAKEPVVAFLAAIAGHHCWNMLVEKKQAQLVAEAPSTILDPSGKPCCAQSEPAPSSPCACQCKENQPVEEKPSIVMPSQGGPVIMEIPRPSIILPPGV